MNETQSKPKPVSRWAWLPAAMPGVAKLLREKRAKFGDAWVNECWNRSVVQLEPDWLFCREGALAIGAPFVNDPALAHFAAAQVTSTQALVVMREPQGGNHGPA